MTDFKQYQIPSIPTAPIETVGGLEATQGGLKSTNLGVTPGGSNEAKIVVGQGNFSAGLNAIGTPTDIGIWAGATHDNRASAPFRVTGAGSLVATDATITGAISASTIDIGGADATSFHVDIDGNMWLGNAVFASGPFRVSNAGAVTATSGTIGGWTLGSATLVGGDATLASSGNLTLGTSNDVVRLSADDATYRLWIGHATAGSAPFRITKAGALTATSATITGTVTATSGAIGGFTLGATTLTATNLILDSSGQRISLGSSNDIIIMDADDATYRLWIGNATAASAPFSVTKAGAVVASDIAISGTNSTFNSSSVVNVQERAESFYTEQAFFGHYNDGLTENTTNGTITRSLVVTTLDMAATAGHARLSSADTGYGDWSDSFELTMVISISDTGGSDTTFFFGLTDTGQNIVLDGFDTAEVKRHVGFFVDSTGSTIISSNADATTQTTNAVSGVTLGNLNVYRIRKTGSSIAFYVNDVLKNTHTTNIPASTQYHIEFGLDNGSSNAQDGTMVLGNNYLLIRYL